MIGQKLPNIGQLTISVDPLLYCTVSGSASTVKMSCAGFVQNIWYRTGHALPATTIELRTDDWPTGSAYLLVNTYMSALLVSCRCISSC